MANRIAIPAEVKDLHRRLSARGVAFLEAVEQGRSRLESVLSRSRLPAWHRSYPYPVQSWPLFVSGAKLAELRGATLGVAGLLKRIPETVFGGDPAKIARFYGLGDPMIAEALLQQPDGRREALVRGDFIDSAEGFKCVEYNTTASLGGWQVHFYADELLASSPVRELRGSGAGEALYVDPLQVLFWHIARQAESSGLLEGGSRLHVAVVVQQFLAGGVENPEGLPQYLEQSFASWARRDGRQLRCSLQVLTRPELRVERGRVLDAEGRRVHAVLEYRPPDRDPELFRAFKGGRVDLYNSPLMVFIGDKRNLALLHEHAESPSFSEEERRCIRRHVPASAVVAPGEVWWKGTRRALEALLAGERQRLVLKHAFGSRGSDLFLGWSTSAERWSEACRTALGSGQWIVQERVESLPYWCMGRQGPGPHDVVWGLFAIGDRYGGGFLRMAPKGGSGIINSAQGASEGVLLEIEAEDE